MDRIFELIRAERAAQDAKWGDQSGNSPERWGCILTEEAGEAAKEVLEEDVDALREELVQVAAVAVAWLEVLERDGLSEESYLLLQLCLKLRDLAAVPEIAGAVAGHEQLKEVLVEAFKRGDRGIAIYDVIEETESVMGFQCIPRGNKLKIRATMKKLAPFAEPPKGAKVP